MAAGRRRRSRAAGSHERRGPPACAWPTATDSLRDDGEVAGLEAPAHSRSACAGHRAGARRDLGADVEAAAEGLHVVDRAQERSGGRGADDDREDDQREHRQRHAGAEAHAQRVGHRHLEHRREGADATRDAHRRAEQDVGVVDDQPGGAGDEHQAADDPGREVHGQFAPGDRRSSCRTAAATSHQQRRAGARVRDPLGHRPPRAPAARG